MKTLYRIEITPKQFWLIGIPLFLLFTLFVGLLTYLCVDKLVMPSVVGSKNRWEITVPGIVGMSVDSAKSVCRSNGVVLTEARSEYNDTLPANTIISQEPEAGSVAKQGRHIMAVTSKGSEIASIPTVMNLQEGPAKRALRNDGFTNIAVSTIYSSDAKKDICIGTDPSEGSVTSREARVTLLLSKGPKPSKAEVPDLLGAKLSDARSTLESVGLTVGTLTYESQPETAPGIVIKQSATAGSAIPLESSVDLVISIE